MADLELLAPAGDLECLKTAVLAGADAVYFGGGAFNARNNAKNLSLAELSDGIDFCHTYGAKAYITLNTQIHDIEFSKLSAFCEQVYQLGADALIVADLGVAGFLKTNFPDFNLHASTQMSICNRSGADFLYREGFSRVVLARELDEKNIRTVAKNTQAEIEIFVHGALCVSYSGQCFISSFIGGRSGNRGKCAQPCRLPYTSEQTGFLMSLKDYCLIEHLQAIKSAGVKSLKIEGRMKGNDYVGEVVSIYRNAIDCGNVTEQDVKRLQTVFHRGGYTDGYFTKRVDKSMFCYDKPDNPYEKQQKENFTISEKKLPISVQCIIEIEKPVQIIFWQGSKEYIAYGQKPIEPAKAKAVTKEDVLQKLNRMGDTPFFIEQITIKIDENIWFPISELNHLRRSLCDKIVDDKKIRRIMESKPNLPKFSNKPDRENKLSAYVSNLEQYKVVAQSGIETIYVPYQLICSHPSAFKNPNVTAYFPPIWFDDEQDELIKSIHCLKNAGINNALISNLGYLPLLDGFDIATDFNIGFANSSTTLFLKEHGVKLMTLSVELNHAQIRDMKTDLLTEVIIYGRLPLMYYENCPASCKSCSLRDRMGKVFPLSCKNLNGRSALYNTVALYLLDSTINADKKRLLFTFETAEEVKKIIVAAKTKTPPIDTNNITRGHYTRGV